MSKTTKKNAAQFLKWASIAIGFAELFTPGMVQTLLGLRDHPRRRRVLQALGVRELAHGASLMAAGRSKSSLTKALAARSVGDLLDTALLGKVARMTTRRTRFALVATAALAIGLLDAVSTLRTR